MFFSFAGREDLCAFLDFKSPGNKKKNLECRKKFILWEMPAHILFLVVVNSLYLLKTPVTKEIFLFAIPIKQIYLFFIWKKKLKEKSNPSSLSLKSSSQNESDSSGVVGGYEWLYPEVLWSPQSLIITKWANFEKQSLTLFGYYCNLLKLV